MSDAMNGTTTITSEREAALATYQTIIEEAQRADSTTEALRELCRRDIFFLGYYVLLGEFFNNDWCFDRCREFQNDPDGHLDLWPREHFKDLALDTPMLTANRGWTTHGELKVGDFVFSPNGLPTPVVALSPRYSGNRCLRVTFEDGASIVCGEGHLWRVRRHKRMKRDADGYRAPRIESEVIEARDLRVGDDVGAIESELQYDRAPLPIGPYTLGMWLGNGDPSHPRVTCNSEDHDIPMYMQAEGYEIGVYNVPERNAIMYSFGGGVAGKKGTGCWPVFRDLGLEGNKHIPEVYKRASVEDRWELLRGLMDSDGHSNGRGTATFSSTSRLLAMDVYELALSLSLRPRLAPYTHTINGEPYRHYRVSFRHHIDRDPFHSHRKSWKAIAPTTHRLSRYVTGIEEVESVPTSCIQVLGGLYLAGRELVPTHNSTLITLCAAMWAILNNPDITIGIFSFNRPIAKGFLRLIKWHCEQNEKLRALFPDIIWANPEREAPKWSEDDGIILHRTILPGQKEATVEAWGVIDGQPTSKHYDLMIYDDVVTKESVSTPTMIENVTYSVSLSFNLGKQGGRRWMLGTRYHFADTYSALIKRGAVKPRVYAATKDGKFSGEPWLLTRAELDKKITDQGPYVASCQLFNNPVQEGEEVFLPEWLQSWRVSPQAWRKMNVYILVDPAGEKKKTSDYTSMFVFGLGRDRNYYVVDMIHDKLSLLERADTLFELVEKYRPKRVGYEKYGMQSDIEFIKLRQDELNFRFPITALGGTVAKNDRIKGLQPICKEGRFFLPDMLQRVGHDRKVHDLVKEFIEDEYMNFPYMAHDDMLDCASRIVHADFKTQFPSGGMMDDGDAWSVDEIESDSEYSFDTFAYVKGR